MAVVPITVRNIRPINTDMRDSNARKLPRSTISRPAMECKAAQTITDVSVDPIGSSAVPATPHALASARPTITENSER